MSSDPTRDSSVDYLLLTKLADEFAARLRAGEYPSIQEYVDRHPELEADIRDLFPAMLGLERVRKDHDSEPAQPAPVIRQLGDFRILRQVGRGGMGIVYEAEQVSLGRHVALKVLPRSMLLDARAKSRFEREAKAAAKLHHTNIVPVFGVGEQDGMPYYVMQYIQGLGLDEVLTELRKLKLAGANPGDLASGGLHVSRKSGNPTRIVEAETTDEQSALLSASDLARTLFSGDFATTEASDSPIIAEDAQASPGSSGNADASSVVLPGGKEKSGSRRRGHGYWRSVATIGAQVAGAIDYAHRQGINHRDIKPSNLLLDQRGTVWVTDFGLAKADDQKDLTHTGDLLGTLRYMPPEAFEGKADARGDVYSLGLTLYEMLGLQPAHGEADRNRLIRQVTEAEPPRLGKLNPKIPQDLETIIHKAIEKDPERRYSSAGAMAADLQRFLDDEPIEARRITQAERLWRWSRRHKAIAALAGLLAVSMIAGTAFSLAFALRARDESQRANRSAALAKQESSRATQEATRANQQAEEARRQREWSERLRYISEVNLAKRDWDAGSTDAARTRLASLVPKKQGDLDLRGWEWYFLDRTFRQGMRLLKGPPRGSTQIALAPDGRKAVVTGADDAGQVTWIIDLVSGRKLQSIRSDSNWLTMSLSPDGRMLAQGGFEGKVTLRGTATLLETRSLPGHQGRVMALAFSPDGRTLATGDDGSTIRFWDVDSGRLLGKHRGRGDNILFLAYAPDGRTLAWSEVGSEVGTVTLWNIATQKELRVLSLPGAAWSLAFSPDGRTLATPCVNVSIWDTSSGRELATLEGDSRGARKVAFATDGRTLAATDREGDIHLWDTTTWREMRTLRNHTGTVEISFSPDGRRLLSASHNEGEMCLRDLATPGEGRPLRNRVPIGEFSPDGQTMVGRAYGDTLTIFDLKTGRKTGGLMVRKSVAGDVWLGRDGRMLSVFGGFDGTVRIWDVAERRETLTLPGRHQKDKFAPDGRRLVAIGADGNLRIFETSSGTELASIKKDEPDSRITLLVFSPDGLRMATSGLIPPKSDFKIRIREGSSGRLLATLPGHEGGVNCFQFSPDGKTLASGGRDGMVRIWDCATYRELAAVHADRNLVLQLAFTPDGKRLATLGFDKAVKIWDTTSYLETLTLRDPHSQLAPKLLFSPDGQTLAINKVRNKKVISWLYEAKPLTVQDQAQHEALGLVRSLLDRSSIDSLTDLVEGIRQDGMISEEVRTQAMTMASTLWENRLDERAEDEASKLVTTLFEKAPLLEELEAELRTRPGMDPKVRALALGAAACRFDRSIIRKLKEASWAVVHEPGHSAAEYRYALRRAEEARGYMIIGPEENFVLSIAHYRNGNYREFQETLSQIEGMYPREGSGEAYVRRAFLAMTQFKLGQIEEARRSLRTLQADFRAKPSAHIETFDTGNLAAIISEAEAVIELDPKFPENPFAP